MAGLVTVSILSDEARCIAATFAQLYITQGYICMNTHEEIDNLQREDWTTRHRW